MRVEVAKTGQFDHVAQRIRDTRAEKARKQAKTEELTGQGITVVDRPTYGADTAPLTSLIDADRGDINPEQHQQCPGHTVYLTDDQQWIKLSEVPNLPAGWEWEPPEPEEDDSEAREDPDVYAWGLTAKPVCQNYAQHGHHTRSHSDRNNPGAERTEAEKEQARAERRDVIESNKAWKSATTVRREFVTRLLTRKTAPKGAVAYIAGELAQGDHALRRAMEDGHTTACDLLGTDIETGTYGTRSGRNPLAKLLSTANDGRAHVISLGIILAAQEAATSTASWRHVQPDTSRYLTFLAEQGYPLAHVEQRARGQGALPDDTDPNGAES